MKNCRVCGAERVGKRYNCIQCSASLLIRSSHRGRTPLGDENLANTPEHEVITSLGVVVSMEAILEDPLSSDWKWMVEQFRTTVEREHGYTVAILGTEVFAYFGMGDMKEREVERAVDASLFVMDGILRRMGPTEVRFAVEVGAIDTEETGMSWGTARMSGPGVQTVRRLIRKAPEAGVFVGPNVWREIRSLYESVSLGGMHKLLNRRRVAILREPSMVAGQTVPLVGRDYEIEHLERALKRVISTGRLVVVPVLGPAGIGKSRLLSEFLNQLNQRSERCEVDVGHCIPSNEGVPFAPFRSSFRNRYRLHGETDPHAIDAALRNLPGVRDLPTHAADQRIRHLATLLGLESEEETGQSTEAWNSPADHSQDVAFDAYCDYVRSMTGDAPYVLALDDLQWIRPSSAKLLSTIATHCADRPVLVILTVRLKDAPQVLGSLDLNISAVSSIELGALSRRHVEQLVSRLFGDGVLDNALLGTLFELSNGIPQELEGHLEALVEGGILQKTETGWLMEERAEGGDSTLPRSLRELVQQRLVRLGPEEQRILRAGALAGPSFSVALLSAMVDRPIDDREVDALVADGWLLESDAGDFPRSREVSFRQDRVRETLLEMIGTEATENLHRKAASWLSEEESGIHPSARTARLARHFSASGNYREAGRFTLEKARELGATFAAQEAYATYGEAMELLNQTPLESSRDDERGWWIEAGLGRAHHAWLLGNHEEAEETLNRLNECVSRQETPLMWCRQQALFGDIRMFEERYEEADFRFQSAIEVADELSLEGVSSKMRGRLIFAKNYLKRVDEAVALAHEILKVESPVHRKDPLWNIGAGSANGFLAQVAIRNREYDQARTHYREAMAHRKGAQDPVGMWMAKMGEGTVYFFEGNLVEAERAYAETARELQNLGYRLGAAQARVNLAEAKLQLEKTAEALVLLEESEPIFRGLQATMSLVETLRCRGVALLKLGRYEEAKHTVEEAVLLAEENGLEQALPALEKLRGEAVTGVT